MDLYERIGGDLRKVNCVQLQGEKSVTTYIYDSKQYIWIETYDGQSHRRFGFSELVHLIASVPHVTKIHGSILVVTMIDTSVRIE